MNPEQLSDAMNELPQELLEETQAARSRRRPRWKPLAAAAACLLLAAGAWALAGRPAEPAPDPDLPVLTIDRDYSGMGDYPLSAEEFAAYDGGPWREGMELAALPVFRNTTRMDVANGFRTGGGDYAQLRRTMEQLAAAAGADVAQAAVEVRVPDETVQAAMEAKYGLDKPVLEQYFTYLGDIVLRFDFGPSLKQRGRQVIDIIADGMKVSAKLGLIAAFGALVVGIVLGAVAALQRNKVIDKVIMVITTAFVSMPSFIAGALLLTIFAVSLHLLPANGAQKNGLILPVVTLGLYPMAYITRLTRSSMLDVLGQDYIRTARAKGVPGFKVIFGHALKNSLIPVITYFGPMLAYIVTGSIIVEQIFAVPGIGRAFVNSITGRDYPLIMGTTIILACLIIIMNLVSDLLYKIVDPRIELD